MLPQPAEGANHLFVTVRPDWRDSKSLLGYYNPLTGTYEWTPFLRFLLRAEQNHKSKDKLAWFVILDEMNLAHVEYYFADLLSVLESGRDEDGWTREPLRWVIPMTPKAICHRVNLSCRRTFTSSAQSTWTKPPMRSARRCSTGPSHLN